MLAISVVTIENPPASTNVIKSADTSSNTPKGTEEPITTDTLATHKSTKTEGSTDVPRTSGQSKSGISAGMGEHGIADSSTNPGAPFSSNAPKSAGTQLSLGVSSSTVVPTTTDGLSSSDFFIPGIEQTNSKQAYRMANWRKLIST